MCHVPRTSCVHRHGPHINNANDIRLCSAEKNTTVYSEKCRKMLYKYAIWRSGDIRLQCQIVRFTLWKANRIFCGRIKQEKQILLSFVVLLRLLTSYPAPLSAENFSTLFTFRVYKSEVQKSCHWGSFLQFLVAL